MKKNDLLLLIAVWGLTSCSGITLTPASEKMAVKLQMDWKEETTAGVMKAYFYPMESTDATLGLPVFAEGNNEQINTQLPKGNYRVLTYNTDVTGLTFSEMTEYEKATVSLERVATRAQEIFVMNPSQVYACGLSEHLVVSGFETVACTASPRQLTRSLNLQISLSEVKGVDAIEGNLCGVYPALLLATGKPSPASVASAPFVRSSFRVDAPSANVTVEFRTLGMLNPEGGKIYWAILKMVLSGKDGWKQEVELDLTDVLTEVIDNNSNDLPIKVPVEIELVVKPVGTSLQATVKSWRAGEGEGTIFE